MKNLIYLGAVTNKLREILAVCLGSVFILEAPMPSRTYCML